MVENLNFIDLYEKGESRSIFLTLLKRGIRKILVWVLESKSAIKKRAAFDLNGSLPTRDICDNRRNVIIFAWILQVIVIILWVKTVTQEDTSSVVGPMPQSTWHILIKGQNTKFLAQEKQNAKWAWKLLWRLSQDSVNGSRYGYGKVMWLLKISQELSWLYRLLWYGKIRWKGLEENDKKRIFKLYLKIKSKAWS